jgi:hypothetical protein
VKIFLGILSSILSRWPSQLILCPFIHFLNFLLRSSLLVYIQKPSSGNRDVMRQCGKIL